VVDPTGIAASEVRKILAELEATGEIQNVPPAQLLPILAKAKSTLKEQPTPPAKPPTP